MTSELIDFENELIRFENIDINDGIVYFFFVVNKSILQENDSDISSYNRLILSEVGIREGPLELSFSVGDYTQFKVTIKINITKEIKEESNKKNEEVNPIPLSQIIDSSAPKSLVDRIRMFSTTSNSNTNRNVLRARNQEKNKNNESKDTPGEKAVQEPKSVIENSKENLNKNNLDVKFEKKYSVPVIEHHVKSQFEVNEELDKNESFLKGIPYDRYLAQLKQENKKEYETGRETFCEGFFITSFPQKNGQVIENSQSFPAACGHDECSSLPAMKPEIIVRYPLEDTKYLELNNLAATICFPTGIKVCYSEEKIPAMIKDYVTPIINVKGDRYYMVTYHFYYKIMNDVYSKLYEMHPLKHHLMKFGDSYLNLSNEEMNESIMIEIQNKLEQSQELGFRDYIYVPYCICLISKYPFVTEMKKCLQSIYTMIINNLKDNTLDLNNLIMYLIHSVPIPERETKVKFFIPYFNKSIKLICPKMHDINIVNTKISILLNKFNIDNIVIIFRLMLFEKRILFIDDDYTTLSLVADNFISLLYPFQWEHTYIPIMSDQMLQMLQSFLPFVNGINSSLINLVKQIFEENQNEDNSEVFLIYIKENKFKLGSTLININKKKYKYLQDNVPALPTQMEKELKNKLKIIKGELDSYIKANQKNKKIDLNEFDLRIKNVFIEMFVQMFHDYYKYMTFLDDDVVFNKSLFLEKITNANDKKFYDEFIDTQLFQQFCQNIVKDELKYFTKMVMNYDPNKKDKNALSLSMNFSSPNLPQISLNRTLTEKPKGDKVYIIKPNYLEINNDNTETIEKKMEEKFKLEEEVDDDGILKSKERIITEIGKLKNENYKNKNCYIYIIPESQITKSTNPDKYNQKEITSDNIIFKALQQLKLKSNKKFSKKSNDDGISEKEKDTIKETIKDFTMNIFTSKDIDNEQNMKKDLQNTLNTPFGRQFFVNILSRNVTNIILLKEKSFHLLGTLIYNTLLFILNIQETDILLEQMVILVKSTKYFGKEIKGNTTTLWKEYKSKIQGYSKVNQNNFWEKWYEIEIKKNDKLNDDKKKDYIFIICDYMIELELDKHFIKNVIQGIAEKQLGKESEELNRVNEDILEKIKQAKYSKPTIK